MTCTSTPSERRAPEAIARHHVYAVLSRAFLSPDDELVEALASGALFDALEAALEGCAGELVDGLPALRSAWADVPDSGAPDARTRYHRVFGHSLSPDYPPYETQYGMAHPFQQSERLADLLGFYRSFGLQISPGLHDRADHLAVELEFMGFLALKEALHVEKGEELHLAACRAGTKYFLRQHLGPAVVSFAERVTRLGPDGFYKEVARFAAAFVRHDSRRIGIGLDNPLELIPWDDAALAAAVEEL